MLPLLITVFPQVLLQKEKSLAKYLHKNQNKLITVWDLYHTLKHIPVYPNSPTITASFSNSLFNEILYNRTCEQAGIASTYCLCTTWQSKRFYTEDQIVNYIANCIDSKINSKLQNFDSQCMKVTFDSIKNIYWKMGFINPTFQFLEPIIYFKIYFYGSPGKQFFELSVSVLMDNSLTEDEKYNILFKEAKPSLSNKFKIEYFRRLSTMNNLELQAKKPVDMEKELCVVRM